ncbi:hypothetical protein [Pseudopedobacter saltans]|nr:hypothetical protein [Pseudopedobacter saltans]
MSKTPENKGKKWSKEDLETLKKLSKNNTPTGLIAHELKRSENSIRNKSNQINVSLKPTNKSPYDRKVSNAKKSKD